ncbi:TPA: hypothetical protein ACF2EP_003618 [Acinetobacter baumannii]
MKKKVISLDVFSTFFSVSSAISFNETFGEYRLIKLTDVDLRWQMLEERRQLEEYDQLEGETF